MRPRSRPITVAVCALLIFLNVRGFAQSPPLQPSTGPGAEGTRTVTFNSYGGGATQYWIYRPQPQFGPAPVIVFMHGFAALAPSPYQAWIDHIVKRGNIVIFPRYQESASENPKNFTGSAIFAIRSALQVLGAEADLSRVAFVGHSYGAVIQFNIAGRAVTEGLPVPKAIFAAHPGDSVPPVPSVAEYSVYPQIPSSTPVLFLAGDADDLVGDLTARTMIANLPHVTVKNFLTVQSDAHGSPPLVASHFAPNAPPTDALDYFAYWKLSDALVDFAFFGAEGDFALGGTDRQIGMGSWSDGVAVKSLSIRPTFPALGILNAATLQPGPIAPGELVLVKGAGLGPRELQPMEVDSFGRISRSLAGTRVLFQGIPSPIVYAFLGQVAAVVPYGIAGLGTVIVQVEVGSYVSAPITVGVATTSPGIFTTNGAGAGQGSILNQNSSANSRRNPATKGSRIVIYATGAGENTVTTPEGLLTLSSMIRPKLPVAVTIGGIPAQVTFAGAAPGFYSGVLQVNAIVPDLPAGEFPLGLTVGATASQPGVTVAVK